MKALVFSEVHRPLKLIERTETEPRRGEVMVGLRGAALNRRDFWITQGMYPGLRTGVILGSDGAGVVERIGDGVEHHWSNQPVVINPGWDWGEQQRAQGSEFRILGMPDDGTFAERVCVPAKYLHLKPEHLDWPQAAALPLGGVTAYRAVFVQGGLTAGDRVLITGVGGGVATFALQYALVVGAATYVTSSSAEKLERAEALGARAGYNYTQADWVKRAQEESGGFDLIIDSAGGEGYGALIELAAPGGRIVHYGATGGPPKKLDLFKVFWKQLHLIGSTMGSPADFAAMLEFVQTHRVIPLVDSVLPLAEGPQAVARMKDSSQFGKVVLTP